MWRKEAARIATITLCSASLFAADGLRRFTNAEPANDRARALFLDACTACHTLERVKSQRLTADEWRQVTAGMISEGIALTDEEVTLVVEYLAKNFGPETP